VIKFVKLVHLVGFIAQKRATTVKEHTTVFFFENHTVVSELKHTDWH